MAMLRWGLVPAWAPDPAAITKTFNARAETLTWKPTFRDSFLRRRCLIPMSRFYEWDACKTPVYFHPRHEPLFAFAGL